MNESMIESCSSPDYSRQEMELGKDFFFDLNPPSADLTSQKANQPS